MTERTDPTTMETFGETIAAAREARGWSAAQLGLEVGRSAATVRAWEQNRRLPDDEELAALATTLELDARDMVELRGPLPVEPEPVGDGGRVATAEHPAVDSEHAMAPGPDEPGEADSGGAVAPWHTVVPEVTGSSDAGVPVAGSTEDGPGAVEQDRSTMPDTGAAPTATAPVMADPIPYEQTRPPDHNPDPGGIDVAELASRAVAWVRDRWRRRRLLARAPTQVKSYIEDDRQATTYRIRIVLTAVALVVLVLVLRWAWSQFAEALSALFETLRAAI